MKGIEHFRAAEWNMEYAKDSTLGSDKEEFHLKMAQVHATLAAAVAVSNLVTVWGDIAGMIRADSELADVPPTRAEPLVTCNAAPADDGPERCGLAIGHDGLHEHDAGGGRIVSWSTPDEMATIAPARPYVAGADPFYQSTATDLHMEMPR